MIAYQYFHLPNGYVGKTSDNDVSLPLMETLRVQVDTNPYYLYVCNNDQGYLLASKIDENKNQFIKGRIFKLDELNALPLQMGTLIPDMRLMRQDMSLVARQFMIPPFVFKPYLKDKYPLALALDNITERKKCCLVFSSMDDAVLIFNTLLSLLPLEFSKTISFVISDTLIKNEIEFTSVYGEKTLFNVDVNLLTRPLNNDELGDFEVVDFTSTNERKPLSVAGESLFNADLSNSALFTSLKNEFATYIDKNGLNLAVISTAEKEKAFYEKKNLEALDELLLVIEQVPFELSESIMYRLGNYYVKEMEESTLDDTLFNQIPRLKNLSQPFNDVVSVPYTNYLSRNYLSLEGEAENDFAMMLSTSSEFDSFFSELYQEENNKRKAKRIAILLLAIYYSYSSGNADNDLTQSRYQRLMDLVSIANCYQLISYEEKNNGEDLFFGISEDGNFTSIEIERIAFLVYSAYLTTSNDEWKKIRLKGLEVRINKLPILEKLRILNEIKKSLEYFSAILYSDNYVLTDLNSFYFDIYSESLKSELKRAPYKEKMMFYDEYQTVPYLALTSAVIESLSSLPAFLDAYRDLTNEEEKRFLSLFRSMPESKETLEIINYLSLLNKESQMNDDFALFRMNFITKCYNLLPKDKKDAIELVSNNDLFSKKQAFSESVASFITTLKGDTSLASEIEVKTRDSTFQIQSNQPQINISKQENTNISKTNTTKPFLYLTIKYTPSSFKRFKVTYSLEGDKAMTLSPLVFIAGVRNIQVEDDTDILGQTGPLELKKAFLKPKPVANGSIELDPLKPGKQIFVIFQDENTPYALRVIHSK